jgi:hypothetical protein
MLHCGQSIAFLSDQLTCNMLQHSLQRIGPGHKFIEAPAMQMLHAHKGAEYFALTACVHLREFEHSHVRVQYNNCSPVAMPAAAACSLADAWSPTPR